MKKFVRLQNATSSDRGQTIAIDRIVNVEGSAAADAKIIIYTDVVTHSDGSPLGMVYEVTVATAGGANLSAGNKRIAAEDINNKITDAYTKSWTNPLTIIDKVKISGSQLDVGQVTFNAKYALP